MISDTEELKKEKVLNWIMPVLCWNVMFSVVIGILIDAFVLLEILPPSIILPIFGKISTILVSIVGINVFASIGAIEDIEFNYRCFNSKLEDQEVNKSKLKIIERKIKSEQKYLDKLKQEKQNTSNLIETSSSNELIRLKLLKNYLSLYVDSKYVPKSFFHEKDILKCYSEMEKNYPYNSYDENQNEIEEVKTLLKNDNI